MHCEADRRTEADYLAVERLPSVRVADNPLRKGHIPITGLFGRNRSCYGVDRYEHEIQSTALATVPTTILESFAAASTTRGSLAQSVLTK